MEVGSSPKENYMQFFLKFIFTNNSPLFDSISYYRDVPEIECNYKDLSISFY
jgi:hypothetical protein